MEVTEQQVRDALSQVMDPELAVDIVSLGLIYEVAVSERVVADQQRSFVKIVMTLTTPGCPLAGIFDSLVRESLAGIQGLDIYEDVEIELTFDPPWIPDMMTEEVRAELGFD